MHRNFSVGQANELVLDGRIFDLHNWYDFTSLVIFSEKRVQLWFTPSPEHRDNGDVLVIDVQGVGALEITQDVLLGNARDLDEIGYKNPEDGDLDWLIGEHQATSADHLVFRFGPSDYVRVYGDRAQLHVRENVLTHLTTHERERRKPHSTGT